MTSPDAFFIFSKFWFSRLLGGWGVGWRGGYRAGNGPNWQKNLSHSASQELYLIWFWFLVHTCKKMISPAIFFLFLQNSDFSDFSKYINKCQKQILRCAPPSSHVCDFIFSQSNFSRRFLIRFLISFWYSLPHGISFTCGKLCTYDLLWVIGRCQYTLTVMFLSECFILRLSLAFVSIFRF